MVVNDFSNRPSVAETKAGLDANGDPALAAGVVDVPAASTLASETAPTASIRLPNGACCVLAAETVFEIWVVAEVCTALACVCVCVCVCVGVRA